MENSSVLVKGSGDQAYERSDNDHEEAGREKVSAEQI